MFSLKSVAFLSLAMLVIAAAVPPKAGDPVEVVVVEVVEHNEHGHGDHHDTDHGAYGYADVVIVEEHHEVEPAVIVEEHEHEHDKDFEPDVVIEEHVEYQYEEAVEESAESHPAYDTVNWCLFACNNYCQTGAYYEGQESISDKQPIENCDFNRCTATCVVSGLRDYEETLKLQEEQEVVQEVVEENDDGDDVLGRAKQNKRAVDANSASEFDSYSNSSDYMNHIIAAHPSPLLPIYVTVPTPTSAGDDINRLKPANSKAGSSNEEKNPPPEGVTIIHPSARNSVEPSDEVWLSGVCGRLPSRVDASLDGHMKKYYFKNEGLEVLIHREWRDPRFPGMYPPPKKPVPDDQRDPVDVGNSQLLNQMRSMMCI
ncbi:hypothetical protein QBC44DRAFT_404914 [Cladorrhinum sp. PSN332]|nr:hypothetical protein QBC44DRAFT_404914 [Cladorrhinum sp. PSN332]